MPSEILLKPTIGNSARSSIIILTRTTSSHSVDIKTVANRTNIMAMRNIVRDVPIASHVNTYAARLVVASHPNQPGAGDSVKKFVRYGSSPRGAQALVLGGKVNALLAGRYNVSIDDIRSIAKDALRHRLLLNFDGLAENISTDSIIDDLLINVPVE